MSLDLLQRLAVTEFLAKKFAGVRKNELNPEAETELIEGERLAAKFGGKAAAWVSVPQAAVRVQDKDRLLAWCRKNLPTAIETVEQVRPGETKMLTEQVKKYGGWVNGDGEVVPVDGIGAGDPFIKVDLTDDAEAILAAAWQDGSIDLPGMLALEPAPEGGGND